MTSPEQNFLALTKKEGLISNDLAVEAFGALPPLSPTSLLGSWRGYAFETRHPGWGPLKAMKWAGKDFHSVDNVDPIMIYNDSGNRVWKEDAGHARIREVKFRGKVSAAMIYDKMPIIDSFRRVGEDMVAGAMDTKLMDSEKVGVFVFWLVRIKEGDKSSL